MTKPFISVIVAVYNGVKTLQRCIDSVVNQTYPHVELIIMDGGSTDGTVDILKANSDKISCWESKPDRGLYHAWNKALKHTRGEWICFLGADDYFWTSRVLEQMAPYLAEALPSCRVVYGQVAWVNKSEELLYYIGEPWSSACKRFSQSMALPHPGAMHHRGLFDEYGLFDENFKIAGDYEFLLRELPAHDALYASGITVAGMQVGGMSSDPSYSLLLLEEVRKAHRKHGIKGGGRLWAVYIKAWVRILIWRTLGDFLARNLFDLARVVLGKPRYWTRS